jgi:hypothetical protein
MSRNPHMISLIDAKDAIVDVGYMPLDSSGRPFVHIYSELTGGQIVLGKDHVKFCIDNGIYKIVNRSSRMQSSEQVIMPYIRLSEDGELDLEGTTVFLLPQELFEKIKEGIRDFDNKPSL